MTTVLLFVTWNSRTLLEDSIGGLKRLNLNYPIIVVDNGSTDGTANAIRERWPDVNLIVLGQNTGFSGGNNVGIKLARTLGYESVFLLNVDTIIVEDFIQPCLAILEARPDVGIVGPVVLEAYLDNVIQCAGGAINLATLDFPYIGAGRHFFRRKEITPVGYVLGAAMLISMKVINRIGTLDEDYFPAYVEEADFCHRATRAGFGCVVTWDCAIRHIGQQSSGGIQKSFDRLAAHRIYFGIKFLDPVRFACGGMLIVARVCYWKLRNLMRK